MELHLDNRTAIVTGGGGAICGAIERGLAAEGASVAVRDLDPSAAENVAAEIRASSGPVIGVSLLAAQRAEVVAALTWNATERAQQILDRVSQAPRGEPDDIVGAAL